MRLSDCIVRGSQLRTYSPDAHVGTVNRRIIGKETVGAKNIELVLGVVEPTGAAEPHFHTGVEQVVYLLEGRMEVEMWGETAQMGPGDAIYFPPGEMHNAIVVGDRPAKCLVIYSPPIQSAPKPFER